MKVLKNEIEKFQINISISNLFEVQFDSQLPIEQKVINYLYEVLNDNFLLSFNIF